MWPLCLSEARFVTRAEKPGLFHASENGYTVKAVISKFLWNHLPVVE